MVVAVAVGLVLAGVLFIQRIATLTSVTVVNREHQHQDFGDDVMVYDINGPLFFLLPAKKHSMLSITRR